MSMRRVLSVQLACKMIMHYFVIRIGGDNALYMWTVGLTSLVISLRGEREVVMSRTYPPIDEISMPGLLIKTPRP